MDEARLRNEIHKEYPKASAEYVKELVKFEVWFWEFFPAPQGCHEESSFELEWLWTSYDGGRHEAVPHSKALADLKNLEKSLRFISDMQFEFYLPLAMTLIDGRDDETEAGVLKMKILDFVGDLNSGTNDATDGVREAVISDFIADCREAILTTDDKKNINWQAIEAIRALRTLWWRNNERIKAPIALNPETPFADYLRGGFQFLDVRGDIVSAFRA